MVWLWLQALALLVATFGFGLWLGHTVSRLVGSQRPAAVAVTLPPDEDVRVPAPVYHGAELSPAPPPEPVPEQVPVPVAVPVVAEPPPPPPRPEPVVAPPPRVRTPLLFPINQFGIITVTQAPAL